MADAMSIELRGAAELQARLEKLPDLTASNVMRGALARGANKFRDAIRRVAPIEDISGKPGGGTHEPGTLARSIIARRLRYRHRDEVRAGVLILREAFYWRFVEYGTRRAKPHPFIRPVADSMAGAVAQEIVDSAAGRIPSEFYGVL